MCLWLLTAGVGREDGATILPLPKKRPKVVLLAVKDSVVIFGLVFGEAAGTVVLESVGSVLILVRGLFITSFL